jgi:hypothetical protein
LFWSGPVAAVEIQIEVRQLLIIALQALKQMLLQYKKSINEIRDAPDTDFTGYRASRISGQSKSRIPDIRPDFKLNIQVSSKI